MLTAVRFEVAVALVQRRWEQDIPPKLCYLSTKESFMCYHVRFKQWYLTMAFVIVKCNNKIGHVCVT